MTTREAMAMDGLRRRVETLESAVEDFEELLGELIDAGGKLALRLEALEHVVFPDDGEAVESVVDGPTFLERVMSWIDRDPGDECGCGFCEPGERRVA